MINVRSNRNMKHDNPEFLALQPVSSNLFFLAASSLAISSGPQIWLCFQVPRAPKHFICSHEKMPVPKHRKQQISQAQLFTTEMAMHQTWREDKTHMNVFIIVSIFWLLILGMKNNVNL